MKIVIATGIYPPEIGGPAGYSKRLGVALVGRGHRVSLVTYGDNDTDKSQSQLSVTVVPRTGGALVRYARYAWEVLRAARKADLVYLMGPVSEGFPGTVGAILAGRPTVLKVVGDYAWEQYQQSTKYGVRSTGEASGSDDVLRTAYSVLELLDEFLVHRHGGKVGVFEKIERWVARRAKKVVVPSKYLKTVVTKWGIEPSKIEVIYNSVEKLPGVELEARSSEHVMPNGTRLSGKKVILTAVRAVPWKGGDFLCDCLKELPEEFVLAVAGDGPSLEAWKEHAQEIGVSDRVLWLGKLPRKELAQWYRKAHVFALATGYEGFPHVVVEACSVGVPCVVSDKGGNQEIAEMFPGLVKVAAYRDNQAWVKAVLGIVRRESDSPFVRMSVTDGAVDSGYGILDSGILSFDRMVDLTETELKKIL